MARTGKEMLVLLYTDNVIQLLDDSPNIARQQHRLTQPTSLSNALPSISCACVLKMAKQMDSPPSYDASFGPAQMAIEEEPTRRKSNCSWEVMKYVLAAVVVVIVFCAIVSAIVVAMTRESTEGSRTEGTTTSGGRYIGTTLITYS